MQRIRLKTSLDAKKLVARSIRMMLRGDMEESTAKSVGYLLGVFLKAIEISELELRVSALEKQQHKNNNGVNYHGEYQKQN